MKRIGMIFAIACFVFLQMRTAVLADEAIPQVQLTKNGVIEYYNAQNSMENGYSFMELGNAFKGMTPGETRTQSIDVCNKWTKNADFYIAMETIKAMEDLGDATGGAYKVKLTLEKKNASEVTLLDTSAGGYNTEQLIALSQDASKEGLREIKELNRFYKFTTLNPNENAKLNLSITLDGEGMDKAYQAKEAGLAMDFCAFSEEKGQITTVPAKTGDRFVKDIYLLALLAGIACILIYVMRKYQKPGNRICFGIVLASVLFLQSIYPQTVFANEKTYVLTIRAGNVGAFTTKQKTDSYEITSKYIKIYNVPKGTTIEEAVSKAFGEDLSSNAKWNLWLIQQMNIQKEYVLLDAATWIDVNETMNHNEEFVVDYGVRASDTAHNPFGTKYAQKLAELMKWYMDRQNV